MATQLGFREEVITVIEEEMGFSPSDPPALQPRILPTCLQSGKQLQQSQSDRGDDTFQMKVCLSQRKGSDVQSYIWAEEIAFQLELPCPHDSVNKS